MKQLMIFLTCLSFGVRVEAQQLNWAVDAGGGGNTDF